MPKFELQDFHKTGVAFPLDVSEKNMNINWANEYHNFQRLALEKVGSKVSLKPNLLSTKFDSLIADEKVISAVKRAIGENIYVWSSAFFFKGPGDGKIVSFHQDNPYWQLTSDKVVTAWIALTNSSALSGALEVVPGSFKHGLINKLDVNNPRKAYLSGEKTTSEEDLLSYKHDLKDFLKVNEPLAIELEPGQFSLHHVNTVHGSGKNNSRNERIGFAIRYVASETKHSEEAKDTAIHLCGQKSSYFVDEIRPITSFSDDAIKQHEKALASAGAFGNKKY
jgi:ectoine hydroxylase-related dioxygenase (phytanoyl-CoA dioxygenase family)